MIDHIGIPVADYARSKAFYLSTLASIGAALVMEVPASVTESGRPTAGFGRGKPDFWISEADAVAASHVAFSVSSRAQVDAFHAAGLAAGARDNGAPGLRTIYHPDYYGAFLIDPDGHNIEAVCHLPEGSA
ncbi:VOC family protein [Marilutibacter maris]|uniref:Glyoxalase n=1 Tax=Marilutibacter maris TaxID=1605891 RepID=A0A2U9TDD1_9GAMM|nr:VOC family protein [Lysobacter maris]AWV07579.1 glyoxalase [Lysobacter maris]KAB8162732.1 VOC family protein [Lysobacter maris]